MRLSLRIFFDELSHWNLEVANDKGMDLMHYMGAHLLDDDMVPLDQHILLINSHCKNEYILNGEYGIICIGRPVNQIIENNTCILLDENVSIPKLFADIQKIIQKYRLWDESLSAILNNNPTIKEICDSCDNIFENPIIVYDSSLLVLALSNEMPGLPNWEYDEESGRPALPLSILNDFKIDMEFQDTMLTKKSYLYDRDFLGCRGLYNNLWIDNIYSGRVCIHELGRELQGKDYALLDYLSQIITSTIQKHTLHKSEKLKLFEESLKDLLEGNKVNELFFIKLLDDIGWDKDDSHICLKIIMEERDSKTYSSKYTCNRLINNFKNSIVFPYSDSILMIINLSKSDENLTTIMSELKIFLREGLLRAGISMVSNDFFRLHEYYIQTSLAITLGSEIDPMYWYFHFEDYILAAMFHEISKNMPLDMYCERGLFELQKYDKENDSNLFNTLRIYLENNMNIAHASEELFIHRTTLLYRIDRINTLINLNLKNPEDRFKLLLSYNLLDHHSQ